MPIFAANVPRPLRGRGFMACGGPLVGATVAALDTPHQSPYNPTPMAKSIIDLPPNVQAQLKSARANNDQAAHRVGTVAKTLHGVMRALEGQSLDVSADEPPLAPGIDPVPDLSPSDALSAVFLFAAAQGMSRGQGRAALVVSQFAGIVEQLERSIEDQQAAQERAQGSGIIQMP